MLAVSSGRKATIAAAAAPLVVILLITGAWAADGWTSGDRVERNIALAGVDVGNQTPEELRESVQALSERFVTTEVVIDTGEAELASEAGDLGLTIAEDPTVDAVLEMGHDGPAIWRPFQWVRSWFTTREAEVRIDVNPAGLAWSVAVLEGDGRSEPTEPRLEATDEGIVLVPGEDGRALTPNDVITALPTHLGDLDEPIVIEVEQSITTPRFDDAPYQAVVDRAAELTAGGVTLVGAGREVEVDAVRFRPALQVEDDGDGEPRLTVDPGALDDVVAELETSGGNPTNVRFDLQGGGMVPVGGEDATVCCGEDARQIVADAWFAGERRIELPSRTITAAEGREWAAGLGVNEQIGTFTTNHACCESRVTNIQRMADMLRGVLIAPGTTFSVNDTVGPRTVEKGFAEGGVIIDGEFTTDIGGGVSQFATTMFNAAFFAGLDIPRYQMHSRYISRYPYGREATLFYPSVDLQIRNNTPYGIVIWTSYTGTSITVDLWSTRTAVGEQSGQSRSSGCGPVTTERTRLFTDGRVETDTFRANYRCE